MDHVTIKATKRTVGNKQSIKQLRRNGEVPCVLYGHDTENTVFSVKTKDLRVVTHTPNSYIIDLDLDGQIKECIFHDIQFHPVTDEILHMDELACSLIKILQSDYPGTLASRYGIEETAEEAPHDILAKAAVARSCIRKGGEPDTDKAADMIIDDYRAGRLGRISLERPEDGDILNG